MLQKHEAKQKKNPKMTMQVGFPHPKEEHASTRNP